MGPIAVFENYYQQGLFFGDGYTESLIRLLARCKSLVLKQAAERHWTILSKFEACGSKHSVCFE